MILKFQIGHVLPTGAVFRPETVAEAYVLERGSTARIPHFTMLPDGQLFYRLGAEDIVYGLGEQARGINKRGWHYESLNTDDPNQNEGRTALYGAHNFLLIDGAERFGIFIDTPEKVEYDIGYTNYDELVVKPPKDYDLYVLEGESDLEILRLLRKLTGPSYLPPKWAFGFGQSRWGYKSARDVRKIVKKYRELQMPIDMVYMDIDYMDDYKSFTVDAEKFPKFKKFNEEMAAEGIRLIPIIDAGIKIQPGYPVYDEGMEKGYFCTKPDGTPFVLGVWPGRCVFPDVLNPRAAAWFGDQYKALTDAGVRGFWNDMNEPSIFYTEDRLKEAFPRVAAYEGQDPGAVTFFEMRDVMGRLSNDPADYKAFYHQIGKKRVRHDKVHNIYGQKLTEAAAEGLKRAVPEERTLLFSRSSSIGLHRESGIWFGDNISWFSHILMNLKSAVNANMAGFLYSGADVAGFGGDATPDLAMRWLELGIFLPLLRNHSSRYTREQEFFRFGMEADFRNLLKLRYALIPYLYSEFMKAALSDGLFVRPLGFMYPEDARARRVEDQAFIGECAMIAPVYEQNAAGRYVYVPEPMRLFRMRSAADYDTEVLPKGEYFVEAALNEVLVFVPKGKALPLAGTEGVRSVRDLKPGFERVLKYGETPVSYEFYEDDGISRETGPDHIRKLKL